MLRMMPLFVIRKQNYNLLDSLLRPLSNATLFFTMYIKLIANDNSESDSVLQHFQYSTYSAQSEILAIFRNFQKMKAEILSYLVFNADYGKNIKSLKKYFLHCEIHFKKSIQDNLNILSITSL
jgi:hypothetical protein